MEKPPKAMGLTVEPARNAQSKQPRRSRWRVEEIHAVSLLGQPQPPADEFGKIFDGNRAGGNHCIVIRSEAEFVTHFAFDLLVQPVMRHSSNEISTELDGALLGA